MPDAAALARGIWQAGLDAADPEGLTSSALVPRYVPGQRTAVVAIGKAAPAMVRGALHAWGPSIVRGIALVPDGLGDPLGPLEVLEASHPVPDARGLQAAERIGALVDGLGPDDFLLALISGGGSALLADPAPPLDLAGLQRETHRWLASGADIAAFNAWRIEHGTLKGGRMAARAHPAHVLTVVWSDVPGHPELVASGPTLPGSPCIELGDVGVAVDAALEAAAELGWPVEALQPLRGEAAKVGREIARRARAHRGPGVWVAGGECTVTLGGDTGRGGRCQELALAAALELAGTPGVALLAAGTDGRDGPTDAAGALVTGDTAADGADDALERHDSHPWLDSRGALIRTGPTGTNVGDLVVAVKTS